MQPLLTPCGSPYPLGEVDGGWARGRGENVGEKVGGKTRVGM